MTEDGTEAEDRGRTGPEYEVSDNISAAFGALGCASVNSRYMVKNRKW